MYKYLILLFLFSSCIFTQKIVSTIPANGQTNVSINNSKILVTFDQKLNPITISDTIIVVFSESMGRIFGDIEYYDDNNLISYSLPNKIKPNDKITVIIKNSIQTLLGDPIDPYQFSYRYQVLNGKGFFDTLSVKIPNIPKYTITKLAINDFNQDGLDDILIYQPDKFYILQNNSDFSFTSVPINWGYAFVEYFKVADLDSDGDNDILVIFDNGEIKILKNNLNYNFTVQDVYTSPLGPMVKQEFVDVNNDGFLDLLLLYHNLYLFINNKNMNFTYSGIVDPAFVDKYYVNDFDNDGFSDIVIQTESTSDIYLLVNNKDISFTKKPVSVKLKSDVQNFDIYDINSDSYYDIIAINKSNPIMEVYLNDKNYKFISNKEFNLPKSGNIYYQFCKSDFDNDGYIDYSLLDDSINANLFNNFIINSDSLNDFALHSNKSIEDIIPYTFNSNDINGDGAIDLVVSKSKEAELLFMVNSTIGSKISFKNDSIYFNKAHIGESISSPLVIYNSGNTLINIMDISISNSNNFSIDEFGNKILPKDSLTININFQPTDIGVYNDSLTIFSDASNDSAKVIYLSGKSFLNVKSNFPGNFTFATKDSISVSFDSDVEIEDINNSVIVYNSSIGKIASTTEMNDQNKISIHTNQTPLQGSKNRIILSEKIRTKNDTIPLYGGYSWSFINKSPKGFCNFNKQNEIISNSISYSSQLCKFYDVTCLFSIDNTKNKIYSYFVDSLETNIHFLNSINTGANPQGLILADLNSDSRMDIIVSNNSDNNIYTYLSDNNFTFSNYKSYHTGNGPRALAADDLNNDGFIDIIVANTQSNNITVLLNNSDGTFTEYPSIIVNNYPSDICLEDFDNNGAIDIAVSNQSSNNLSIIFNDDMKFTNKIDLITGASPRSVFVADFNNDFYADIAVANMDSNSITIFINTQNRNFNKLTTLKTGDKPVFITGNDFDADLDMDLVVSNFNSLDLSIFRNNGNGIFKKVQSPKLSGKSNDVLINDYDNDGDLDLILSYLDSSKVTFLSNSIDLTSPAAPTGFIGNVEPGRITLSWNISSEDDISNYYIYKGASSQNPFLFDSVNYDQTVYCDTSIMSKDSLYYWLSAVDYSGNESNLSNYISIKPIILNTKTENNIPSEFVLYQNYPNPFNPTTTIRFGLPYQSNAVVKIFDILGREVVKLIDNNYNAGYHNIIWNGLASSGKTVCSGIYLYRIEVKGINNSNEFQCIKKLVFLK